MSLRSGQVKIRKVVKYIQVLLVDKFVSLSTKSDEEVHYEHAVPENCHYLSYLLYIGIYFSGFGIVSDFK